MTAIALTLGLALLVIAVLSAILAGPAGGPHLSAFRSTVRVWEWGWTCCGGPWLRARGVRDRSCYHTPGLGSGLDRGDAWRAARHRVWLVLVAGVQVDVWPLHPLRGDLRSGRRHHLLLLWLDSPRSASCGAELNSKSSTWRPWTDPGDRRGLGPPCDWRSRGTAVRPSAAGTGRCPDGGRRGQKSRRLPCSPWPRPLVDWRSHDQQNGACRGCWLRTRVHAIRRRAATSTRAFARSSGRRPPWRWSSGRWTGKRHEHPAAERRGSEAGVRRPDARARAEARTSRSTS